jgi:STE24 endopeptidase
MSAPLRPLRRRPEPEQRAVLDSPWRDALARAGRGFADADLYVCKRGAANAYAVGKRSVAVTAALLNDVRAGHISHNEFVGVLLHEVGHLVANATKFGPARTWLTAPWRTAVRATYRAATALTSRRQRRWLLVGVASLAFAVAIGQAARAGNCPVVAVLTALIVCTTAAPLADAAISRSSEYAADRFVADTGMGADVAAAITVLDRGRREQSLAGRMLALHPHPDARARALRRGSDTRAA